MTAVAKHLNKHGAMLAVETTAYGNGTPSLATATDGFLVIESPEMNPSWQFDGTRQGRGTLAADLAKVGAAGRKFAPDLVHEFRGPGAAGYTSSAVFSSVHLPIRASGLAGTFTTNHWDYIPISDGFESLVAEIYVRGEKYNGKGIYIPKWEWGADGKSVPRFTFHPMMIGSAVPADSAVATITYPYTSIVPPKAAGITLTLGSASFVPIVKSFNLRYEIQATERENELNANGDHFGWCLGNKVIELDLTLESTLLASATASPYHTASQLHPFSAMEAGYVFTALSLIVGASGNRINITSTAIQIMSAKMSKNGNIAQWDGTLRFVPSNDASEVNFKLTTD